MTILYFLIGFIVAFLCNYFELFSSDPFENKPPKVVFTPFTVILWPILLLYLPFFLDKYLKNRKRNG